MKKLLLLILCVLAFFKANSQFIKEQSIEVSVGYGLSFPYQNVDVYGDGFFAQGEYVFTAYSWLDLRPYAGFIFTGESSNQSLPEELKATASAFLFGGKVSLTAPIPYFAPYLELGLGGSVGEFETSIPLLYRNKRFGYTKWRAKKRLRYFFNHKISKKNYTINFSPNPGHGV